MIAGGLLWCCKTWSSHIPPYTFSAHQLMCLEEGTTLVEDCVELHQNTVLQYIQSLYSHTQPDSPHMDHMPQISSSSTNFLKFKGSSLAIPAKNSLAARVVGLWIVSKRNAQ